MKNKSVKLMFAHQYNVDPENVKVESVSAVGNEYEFKVSVYRKSEGSSIFAVDVIEFKCSSVLKTTFGNN